MNNLQKLADERINYLNFLLEFQLKREAANIEGALRINGSAGRTKYYHVTQKGDTQGCYLKKSEMDLIRALAQKDYNEDLIRAAEKEINYLKRFVNGYPKVLPEAVFPALHPERKKLIDPVIIPDDVFIREWLSQDYKRKEFRSDDETGYYTDSGIRVRSKSEILIINALDRFHIPYLVEKPLYLNGAGWVSPDISLLQMPARREIIWEHYGLLDDRDYRENSFLRKNEAYIANGYFPGDNLIQTFESQKHPLSIRTIENIIRHYFF